MTTQVRHHNHPADFDRVGRFLVTTYRTSGEHINWLQPRWEYMHFHPLIRDVDLGRIGIWEADGEIVGVVHPEHAMGTAYFEVDPARADLKGDMLAYAEEHLSVATDGGKGLRIYINDRDEAFRNVAAEKGYAKHTAFEAMSHFVIPDPFPAASLPRRFHLKSLADDNDMRKIHRAIWRGFDHEGEPPGEGIEERTFMQSAPNFRDELNVVVEASDGHFVSYCGMWYEPVHRIAYVKPVCTDPDYRRMGLASAAVLEGIRRCGELGAKIAYVGAIRPVYLSIGFQQIFNCSAWQREWS